MSKGKYARKRQNSIKRAERQAEQARPTDNKVIVTRDQPKSTGVPSSDRNEKDKKKVGLGKIIKRSSPSDWCLVALTCALAILGYFQFKTMNSQLFVMRNDERAWMDIQRYPPGDASTTIDVSAGAPLIFPLKVLNTGKTPAKNVNLSMDIQFLRASDPVDFSCVEGKKNCMASSDVWGVFSAGGNGPVFARRQTVLQEDVLVNYEEATAWREESSYIAVVGILTYQDVYGVNHWNKFCFWANDPTHGEHTHFNGLSCTRYNSVDTN